MAPDRDGTIDAPFYGLIGRSAAMLALYDTIARIAPLVRHFATGFARRFGRDMMAIDHEVLVRLAAQPWPGNVRELRNRIERTAMLGDGASSRPAREPLTFARSTEVSTHVRPIADLEREEILRALAETRGNKKEAARRLGLSRRALSRRLEKFGLDAPRPAAA